MTVEETRAFEFDVATLERESQFLGVGDRWVINRQQKQAISLIEVLAGGIKLELVQIPGGSFLTGAPPYEQSLSFLSDSESPQHTVTIRPAWASSCHPSSMASSRRSPCGQL
jgi:formylglycine-generating enzyme required for sulfatase activity